MKLKFIDKSLKQLVLFDMDGVVAEFIAGEEQLILDEVCGVYFDKRPLKPIIKIAKKLNKKDNITIGILSSCEYISQQKEKKDWLKKYMPFVDSKNIHVIVWDNEKYAKETRKYAKLDVIKTINGYDKIFLIEDKHDVIKATNKEILGTAHHVSELIK